MSEPIENRKRGRTLAPEQELCADSYAMDRAGDALVAMLNKAATLSNENRDRLADLVDDLSRKLAAAHDRIHQLQSDVEHFRGRAVGAEKWLAFIQREIEETLIGPMTEIGREHAPPH